MSQTPASNKPQGFSPRSLKNPNSAEKRRQPNKALLEQVTGDFVKEQLAHLSGTRIARYWVASFVALLLFLQHVFIYGFSLWAFYLNKFESLQWFMGMLIAATLLETYKVVQIIVEWVFKDRPHKPDCDL